MTRNLSHSPNLVYGNFQIELDYIRSIHGGVNDSLFRQGGTLF
jgi:hypothetical protein